MDYYESGYETTNDLAGATEIHVSFLPIHCKLYMKGSIAQKNRAVKYIRQGLAQCRCADDEFLLHFMCEQVCGVRIVKAGFGWLSA